MGGEYVAIQVQQAQFGMVDNLALLVVDADTTRFPEAAEPRADIAEIGDQLRAAAVARIPARARPELGGDGLLVLELIACRAHDPDGPAAAITPRHARPPLESIQGLAHH